VVGEHGTNLEGAFLLVENVLAHGKDGAEPMEQAVTK